MVRTARAVLFDMDGVLVRSEEIWFRVVEEAGRRFRGKAISREEFTPTFGQGTAADIGAFGLSCTADELDRFYIERFGAHVGDVWVDPDAKDVMRTLRERGLSVGVVTNTVSPLAEEILRAAELREFVQSLSCADLVANAKPAPDLVLHGLAGLNMRAEDAVMIGDSRFDREAARAAGVRFIGFRLEGDSRVDSLRALLE